MLRPGGRFVMSVPAYQWAWSDFDVANGHHRRYTTGPGRRGRRARRLHRAARDLRLRHGLPDVRRRAAGPQGVAAPALDGPVDIVALPRLPAPLNRALLGLSRVDRAVLARRDLPFGSSVFLAATRAD